MSNTFLTYVIGLLILLFVTTGSSQFGNDDGICKSMVETQGYTCSEHTVTTKDGYILSLQRIPNSRSGDPANKPPVLLQHGLSADGTSWLISSTNQALPFILADNGYDVWIASSRGTKYSKRHVSLNSNDKAYWEWSWDELAAYDLPASVEFVYTQTGKKKMHYVGHSLGTLIALAAFSQGKLGDMIRSAALLSPIAHLRNIRSEASKISADRFYGEALYRTGIREFNLKDRGRAVEFSERYCKIPGRDCFRFFTPFTGDNCCINPSKAPALLDKEIQSTSTKNMIHLAQMIRTGTIAMYDYYNKLENMKHYRQPNPPSYIMQNVINDLPLFLSYGGNDFLSDVKDVEILLDEFKNRSHDNLTVQFIPQYAHLDFIVGDNANELVYDPIMNFFKLH